MNTRVCYLSIPIAVERRIECHASCGLITAVDLCMCLRQKAVALFLRRVNATGESASGSLTKAQERPFAVGHYMSDSPKLGRLVAPRRNSQAVNNFDGLPIHNHRHRNLKMNIQTRKIVIYRGDCPISPSFFFELRLSGHCV